MEGTITRRLSSTFNELDNQFKALYSKSDFNYVINRLKKFENKSNRASILAELFDMFKSCGVEYEKDKENKYYENLVSTMKVPKFSEVEKKIMKILFEKYKEYPSPKDYMKRIVDRLEIDDDWKNDTLRLRILKQFIKYGNCLTYEITVSDEKTNKEKSKKVAVYGGEPYINSYAKSKIGRKAKNNDELIENIDDNIFDVLSNATKEERKGKYALIKIADDLAEGKFRTSGATKASLYFFAIVYNMTYYSGSSDEIMDYKSDIEKNLFQDYYTNNLIRYITESYRGHLKEYEVDPSGQGINYKNFAEMVYIYFISKDYSPQEKIKLSNEMINRLKTTKNRNISKKTETIIIRERFTEDILSRSEELFEKFISENYDCSCVKIEEKDDGNIIERKIGLMQVESEQNTAYENYNSILENIKKLGFALEECNYGLYFTDVSAFKKYGYDIFDISEIDKSKENCKQEEIKDFADLLMGVNSFIGNTVDEFNGKKMKKSESEAIKFVNIQEIIKELSQEHTEISKYKTPALFISKPENITRTSMIVAYYYYYIKNIEKSVIEKSCYLGGMGFRETFEDFKSGVDEYLESSFYQPLSGKNIFDLIIVFSAYAYISEELLK